jgi:hypothetical protein
MTGPCHPTLSIELQHSLYKGCSKFFLQLLTSFLSDKLNKAAVTSENPLLWGSMTFAGGKKQTISKSRRNFLTVWQYPNDTNTVEFVQCG